MASTPSSMNLASPIITDMFFTILADSRLGAMRSWQSCRDLFDKGLGKGFWKIDYMQYGLPSQVFTIATADDNIKRYCVPMDNHRPELDLKFFNDICPDKNGTSS